MTYESVDGANWVQVIKNTVHVIVKVKAGIETAGLACPPLTLTLLDAKAAASSNEESKYCRHIVNATQLTKRHWP